MKNQKDDEKSKTGFGRLSHEPELHRKCAQELVLNQKISVKFKNRQINGCSERQIRPQYVFGTPRGPRLSHSIFLFCILRIENEEV